MSRVVETHPSSGAGVLATRVFPPRPPPVEAPLRWSHLALATDASDRQDHPRSAVALDASVRESIEKKRELSRNGLLDCGLLPLLSRGGQHHLFLFFRRKPRRTTIRRVRNTTRKRQGLRQKLVPCVQHTLASNDTTLYQAREGSTLIEAVQMH